MEEIEQFTNRDVKPMRLSMCMTQGMFAKTVGISRAYVIKLEGSPEPMVIPDDIREKLIAARKQLEGGS